RKAFLEFRKEDADALRSLNEVAQRYADPVIEDLYRHFLSFDETKAFFLDPKVLDRVKRMQKEYFLRLTEGEYGADYVADRLRIGTLPPRSRRSLATLSNTPGEVKSCCVPSSATADWASWSLPGIPVPASRIPSSPCATGTRPAKAWAWDCQARNA
ncbi:MAG: hypothetical protein DMF89_06580, partial [Acidobacteria bacterium]